MRIWFWSFLWVFSAFDPVVTLQLVLGHHPLTQLKLSTNYFL